MPKDRAKATVYHVSVVLLSLALTKDAHFTFSDLAEFPYSSTSAIGMLCSFV